MPKGVYKRTAKGKANMKGKCGTFKRTAEMNKKNSEALKRYYAEHPEERKQNNEAIKKTWAKLYIREKQSITIKRYFAKSGTKEKNSKAIKKYFEIPGTREANSERIKKYYAEHPEAGRVISERIKRYWVDPINREAQSKARKRYFETSGAREKNSKAQKIAWEKRAEDLGYPRNYLCPNFNFDSICIFRALDKKLHSRSRYGGTKAGEKKTGRYFVDCFNKKYHFIIEWMENGHYDCDGDLNESDIEKKNYIKAVYPDFTYIIIKQSDWFENGNLTGKITCDITTHILKILSKE